MDNKGAPSERLSCERIGSAYSPGATELRVRDLAFWRERSTIPTNDSKDEERTVGNNAFAVLHHDSEILLPASCRSSGGHKCTPQADDIESPALCIALIEKFPEEINPEKQQGLVRRVKAEAKESLSAAHLMAVSSYTDLENIVKTANTEQIVGACRHLGLVQISDNININNNTVFQKPGRFPSNCKRRRKTATIRLKLEDQLSWRYSSLTLELQNLWYAQSEAIYPELTCQNPAEAFVAMLRRELYVSLQTPQGMLEVIVARCEAACAGPLLKWMDQARQLVVKSHSIQADLQRVRCEQDCIVNYEQWFNSYMPLIATLHTGNSLFTSMAAEREQPILDDGIGHLVILENRGRGQIKRALSPVRAPASPLRLTRGEKRGANLRLQHIPDLPLLKRVISSSAALPTNQSERPAAHIPADIPEQLATQSTKSFRALTALTAKVSSPIPLGSPLYKASRTSKPKKKIISKRFPVSSPTMRNNQRVDEEQQEHEVENAQDPAVRLRACVIFSNVHISANARTLCQAWAEHFMARVLLYAAPNLRSEMRKSIGITKPADTNIYASAATTWIKIQIHVSRNEDTDQSTPHDGFSLIPSALSIENTLVACALAPFVALRDRLVCLKRTTMSEFYDPHQVLWEASLQQQQQHDEEVSVTAKGSCHKTRGLKTTVAHKHAWLDGWLFLEFELTKIEADVRIVAKKIIADQLRTYEEFAYSLGELKPLFDGSLQQQVDETLNSMKEDFNQKFMKRTSNASNATNNESDKLNGDGQSGNEQNGSRSPTIAELQVIKREIRRVRALRTRACELLPLIVLPSVPKQKLSADQQRPEMFLVSCSELLADVSSTCDSMVRQLCEQLSLSSHGRLLHHKATFEKLSRKLTLRLRRTEHLDDIFALIRPPVIPTAPDFEMAKVIEQLEKSPSNRSPTHLQTSLTRRGEEEPQRRQSDDESVVAPESLASLDVILNELGLEFKTGILTNLLFLNLYGILENSDRIMFVQLRHSPRRIMLEREHCEKVCDAVASSETKRVVQKIATFELDIESCRQRIASADNEYVLSRGHVLHLQNEMNALVKILEGLAKRCVAILRQQKILFGHFEFLRKTGAIPYVSGFDDDDGSSKNDSVNTKQNPRRSSLTKKFAAARDSNVDAATLTQQQHKLISNSIDTREEVMDEAQAVLIFRKMCERASQRDKSFVMSQHAHWIVKARFDIALTAEFWSVILEFLDVERKWRFTPLSKTCIEIVEQEINTTSTRLIRINQRVGSLPNATELERICMKALGQCDEFARQNLPVLELLCSKALQPRHIVRMEEETGLFIVMNKKTNIEHMQYLTKPSVLCVVEAVCADAAKEHSVGVALEGIQLAIDGLALAIQVDASESDSGSIGDLESSDGSDNENDNDSDSDSDSNIEQEFKEQHMHVSLPSVQAAREELGHQITVLQNISGSRSVEAHFARVTTLKHTCDALAETIDNIMQVQQLLHLVQPLLVDGRAGEILVPSDLKEFKLASALWVTLLDKFDGEAPFAKLALGDPDVNLAIAKVHSILRRVHAHTANFVQQKRSLFPRFFLISDPDFINIIQSGSNPQIVSLYAEQLFPGCESLLIEPQQYDKETRVQHRKTQKEKRKKKEQERGIWAHQHTAEDDTNDAAADDDEKLPNLTSNMIGLRGARGDEIVLQVAVSSLQHVPSRTTKSKFMPLAKPPMHSSNWLGVFEQAVHESMAYDVAQIAAADLCYTRSASPATVGRASNGSALLAAVQLCFDCLFVAPISQQPEPQSGMHNQPNREASDGNLSATHKISTSASLDQVGTKIGTVLQLLTTELRTFNKVKVESPVACDLTETSELQNVAVSKEAEAHHHHHHHQTLAHWHRMQSMITLVMKHRDQLSQARRQHPEFETTSQVANSYEWHAKLRYMTRQQTQQQQQQRPRSNGGDDGHSTKRATNVVVVRMLSNQFDFGYDFADCSERMIVTPVTDRCFRAMAIGLAHGFGCTLIGKTGSERVGMFSELARFFGRTPVSLMCGSSVKRNRIDKSVLGAAGGGLWLCFENIDNFAWDEIKVLANHLETIFNVRKAIVAASTNHLFHGHNNNSTRTFENIEEDDDDSFLAVDQLKFDDYFPVRFHLGSSFFATVAAAESRVLQPSKSSQSFSNNHHHHHHLSPKHTTNEIMRVLHKVFRPVNLREPDMAAMAEVSLAIKGFTESHVLAPLLVVVVNSVMGKLEKKSGSPTVVIPAPTAVALMHAILNVCDAFDDDEDDDAAVVADGDTDLTDLNNLNQTFHDNQEAEEALLVVAPDRIYSSRRGSVMSTPRSQFSFRRLSAPMRNVRVATSPLPLPSLTTFEAEKLQIIRALKTVCAPRYSTSGVFDLKEAIKWAFGVDDQFLDMHVWDTCQISSSAAASSSISLTATSNEPEVVGDADTSTSALITEKLMDQVCHRMYVSMSPRLLEKIAQLHDALTIFAGVVVVGEVGSGKTTTIALLAELLHSIDHANHPIYNPDHNPNIPLFGPQMCVLFTGALKPETVLVDSTVYPPLLQLLSHVGPNNDTQEYDFNSPQRWIVLDGDVGGPWMDSLTGLLCNKNHQQVLGDGCTVSLRPNTRVLFETLSLAHATPAMANSCGIIVIDSDMVDPVGMFDAWLDSVTSQTRGEASDDSNDCDESCFGGPPERPESQFALNHAAHTRIRNIMQIFLLPALGFEQRESSRKHVVNEQSNAHAYAVASVIRLLESSLEELLVNEDGIANSAFRQSIHTDDNFDGNNESMPEEIVERTHQQQTMHLLFTDPAEDHDDDNNNNGDTKSHPGAQCIEPDSAADATINEHATATYYQDAWKYLPSEAIDALVLFAVMWGVGGKLDPSARVRFSIMILGTIVSTDDDDDVQSLSYRYSGPLPNVLHKNKILRHARTHELSLFDYCLTVELPDPETQSKDYLVRWDLWTNVDRVDSQLVQEKNTPDSSALVVPTTQAAQLSRFALLLLTHGHSFVVLGWPQSGKTYGMSSVLRELSTSTYSPMTIAFIGGMTASSLGNTISNHIANNSTSNPADNNTSSKCLIFVDDVHLLNCDDDDERGNIESQPPEDVDVAMEFVRQIKHCGNRMPCHVTSGIMHECPNNCDQVAVGCKSKFRASKDINSCHRTCSSSVQFVFGETVQRGTRPCHSNDLNTAPTTSRAFQAMTSLFLSTINSDDLVAILSSHATGLVHGHPPLAEREILRVSRAIVFTFDKIKLEFPSENPMRPLFQWHICDTLRTIQGVAMGLCYLDEDVHDGAVVGGGVAVKKEAATINKLKKLVSHELCRSFLDRLDTDQERSHMHKLITQGWEMACKSVSRTQSMVDHRLDSTFGRMHRKFPGNLSGDSRRTSGDVDNNDNAVSVTEEEIVFVNRKVCELVVRDRQRKLDMSLARVYSAVANPSCITSDTTNTCEMATQASTSACSLAWNSVTTSLHSHASRMFEESNLPDENRKTFAAASSSASSGYAPAKLIMFPYAVGHILRFIRVLCLPGRAGNLILLGPKGCGRNSLVRTAAYILQMTVMSARSALVMGGAKASDSASRPPSKSTTGTQQPERGSFAKARSHWSSLLRDVISKCGLTEGHHVVLLLDDETTDVAPSYVMNHLSILLRDHGTQPGQLISQFLACLAEHGSPVDMVVLMHSLRTQIRANKPSLSDRLRANTNGQHDNENNIKDVDAHTTVRDGESDVDCLALLEARLQKQLHVVLCFAKAERVLKMTPSLRSSFQAVAMGSWNRSASIALAQQILSPHVKIDFCFAFATLWDDIKNRIGVAPSAISLDDQTSPRNLVLVLHVYKSLLSRYSMLSTEAKRVMRGVKQLDVNTVLISTMEDDLNALCMRLAKQVQDTQQCTSKANEIELSINELQSRLSNQQDEFEVKLEQRNKLKIIYDKHVTNQAALLRAERRALGDLQLKDVAEFRSSSSTEEMALLSYAFMLLIGNEATTALRACITNSEQASGNAAANTKRSSLILTAQKSDILNTPTDMTVVHTQLVPPSSISIAAATAASAASATSSSSSSSAVVKAGVVVVGLSSEITVYQDDTSANANEKEDNQKNEIVAKEEKKNEKEEEVENAEGEEVMSDARAVMALARTKWKKTAKMLARGGPTNRLKRLDACDLEEELMRDLHVHIFQNPVFVAFENQQASRVPRVMHAWLVAVERCHDISLVAKPVGHELACIESEVKTRGRAIRALERELRKAKHNLREAKANMKMSFERKDDLQNRVESNTTKLTQAKALGAAMNSQQKRWIHRAEILFRQAADVQFNALATAFSLVILSPFPASTRSKIRTSWPQIMRETFPNEKRDFSEFGKGSEHMLAAEDDLQLWKSRGLLAQDPVLLESAHFVELSISVCHKLIQDEDDRVHMSGTHAEPGMVQSAGRWPLIVDPHGYGTAWVKRVHGCVGVLEEPPRKQETSNSLDTLMARMAEKSKQKEAKSINSNAESDKANNTSKSEDERKQEEMERQRIQDEKHREAEEDARHESASSSRTRRARISQTLLLLEHTGTTAQENVSIGANDEGVGGAYSVKHENARYDGVSAQYLPEITHNITTAGKASQDIAHVSVTDTLLQTRIGSSNFGRTIHRALTTGAMLLVEGVEGPHLPPELQPIINFNIVWRRNRPFVLLPVLDNVETASTSMGKQRGHQVSHVEVEWVRGFRCLLSTDQTMNKLVLSTKMRESVRVVDFSASPKGIGERFANIIVSNQWPELFAQCNAARISRALATTELAVVDEHMLGLLSQRAAMRGKILENESALHVLNKCEAIITETHIREQRCFQLETQLEAVHELIFKLIGTLDNAFSVVTSLRGVCEMYHFDLKWFLAHAKQATEFFGKTEMPKCEFASPYSSFSSSSSSSSRAMRQRLVTFELLQVSLKEYDHDVNEVETSKPNVIQRGIDALCNFVVQFLHARVRGAVLEKHHLIVTLCFCLSDYGNSELPQGDDLLGVFASVAKMQAASVAAERNYFWPEVLHSLADKHNLPFVGEIADSAESSINTKQLWEKWNMFPAQSLSANRVLDQIEPGHLTGKEALHPFYMAILSLVIQPRFKGNPLIWIGASVRHCCSNYKQYDYHATTTRDVSDMSELSSWKSHKFTTTSLLFQKVQSPLENMFVERTIDHCEMTPILVPIESGLDLETTLILTKVMGRLLDHVRLHGTSEHSCELFANVKIGVVSVSGQQRHKTIDAVRQAAERGDWVVLQNAQFLAQEDGNSHGHGVWSSTSTALESLQRLIQNLSREEYHHHANKHSVFCVPSFRVWICWDVGFAKYIPMWLHASSVKIAVHLSMGVQTCFEASRDVLGKLIDDGAIEYELCRQHGVMAKEGSIAQAMGEFKGSYAPILVALVECLGLFHATLAARNYVLEGGWCGPTPVVAIAPNLTLAFQILAQVFAKHMTAVFRFDLEQQVQETIKDQSASEDESCSSSDSDKSSDGGDDASNSSDENTTSVATHISKTAEKVQVNEHIATEVKFPSVGASEIIVDVIYGTSFSNVADRDDARGLFERCVGGCFRAEFSPQSILLQALQRNSINATTSIQDSDYNYDNKNDDGDDDNDTTTDRVDNTSNNVAHEVTGLAESDMLLATWLGIQTGAFLDARRENMLKALQTDLLCLGRSSSGNTAAAAAAAATATANKNLGKSQQFHPSQSLELNNHSNIPPTKFDETVVVGTSSSVMVETAQKMKNGLFDGPEVTGLPTPHHARLLLRMLEEAETCGHHGVSTHVSFNSPNMHNTQQQEQQQQEEEERFAITEAECIAQCWRRSYWSTWVQETKINLKAGKPWIDFGPQLIVPLGAFARPRALILALCQAAAAEVVNTRTTLPSPDEQLDRDLTLSIASSSNSSFSHNPEIPTRLTPRFVACCQQHKRPVATDCKALHVATLSGVVGLRRGDRILRASGLLLHTPLHNAKQAAAGERVTTKTEVKLEMWIGQCSCETCLSAQETCIGEGEGESSYNVKHESLVNGRALALLKNRESKPLRNDDGQDADVVLTALWLDCDQECHKTAKLVALTID